MCTQSIVECALKLTFFLTIRNAVFLPSLTKSPTPDESYPRYSRRFKPFIRRGRAWRMPLFREELRGGVVLGLIILLLNISVNAKEYSQVCDDTTHESRKEIV